MLLYPTVSDHVKLSPPTIGVRFDVCKPDQIGSASGDDAVGGSRVAGPCWTSYCRAADYGGAPGGSTAMTVYSGITMAGIVPAF